MGGRVPAPDSSPLPPSPTIKAPPLQPLVAKQQPRRPPVEQLEPALGVGHGGAGDRDDEQVEPAHEEVAVRGAFGRDAGRHVSARAKGGGGGGRGGGRGGAAARGAFEGVERGVEPVQVGHARRAVGVHHQHARAARDERARLDRGPFALVGRQPQQPHPVDAARPGGRERGARGAVARPVVHDDDLVGEGGALAVAAAVEVAGGRGGEGVGVGLARPPAPPRQAPTQPRQPSPPPT